MFAQRLLLGFADADTWKGAKGLAPWLGAFLEGAESMQ
jgi:hypothetical protein